MTRNQMSFIKRHPLFGGSFFRGFAVRVVIYKTLRLTSKLYTLFATSSFGEYFCR